MKVIKSLELNKFVPVSIPRNKDLYERIGGRKPPVPQTGGFVSEIGKSKLDVMADAVSYIEDLLNQNQMPSSTPMPK